MDEMIKTSHSLEIKDFVGALAKAQGIMKPAVFNKVNPHFKTRYADFTSCMDACRQPLSDNGIAVMQYCETIEGKLNLVTMLAHVSGQWVKSEFPLIAAKMDSQGIGSAMTYAKRYNLCGMVGIVADEDVDDDGEAAVGRGKQVEAPKAKEASKPVQKINLSQVGMLKNLKAKLDEECINKINKWMLSTYKTDVLEDLPNDCFAKVFSAFENALKFMAQQQVEVANA